MTWRSDLDSYDLDIDLGGPRISGPSDTLVQVVMLADCIDILYQFHYLTRKEWCHAGH